MDIERFRTTNGLGRMLVMQQNYAFQFIKHQTSITYFLKCKLNTYSHNKHRAFDFVGGGSDKLCRNSIHRVTKHTNWRNELQEK